MKYNEAIEFILTLLKERPKFILGGSVALIAQGAIPEREVADFDFCVNVPSLKMDKDDIKDLLRLCSLETDVDYPSQIGDDYICIKVTSDKRAAKRFGSSFYYNLFLREETEHSQIEIQGHQIQIQSAKEILEYKQHWMRPKDVKDIQDLKNRIL